MAPVTLLEPSDGWMTIRAGPKPCMQFFHNLMFDIHGSHPGGLLRFPTEESLSWAVKECPNGIDSLHDAFKFAREQNKSAYVAALEKLSSGHESTSTKLNHGSPLTAIFNLLVPSNESSTTTPTGVATPNSKDKFNGGDYGRIMGITLTVIVLIIIIGVLGYCLRRWSQQRRQRRDVEQAARRRRVLEVTDPEGRAEETVRTEWSGMHGSREERQTEPQSEQEFELQTMSRQEVEPTQDDRILAAVLDGRNEQLRFPERSFSYRNRY